MAKAAVDCLSDSEHDRLTEWADVNLTCEYRYVLEDAIALAIAFD